ncbi:uncharacterized protein LOC133736186 [Rosa rugosa]|uniref:uncharacterized protein LOC133736186 n=1 Tax=Rosa rugosa TaxID=74645 RepID=UPI002B4046B3|nr:uncharacterized protein LOC133736186 [Rosa rugosa]
MDKNGNASCDRGEALKYVFDLGADDDIIEDEEEEDDDDSDEESEEEDEEEEDDTFNPLDSVDDGTFADQIYPDFVGKEYETLAKKKRKPLGDSRPKGSVKKARKDEGSKESLEEELMEFMMGRPRRRSRKLKKRGRRKGSKNQCSPEISSLLSKARNCYALGDYKEAIPVLKEVIKQAPHLPDSYQTLGDVHSALGDKNRALNCYHVAGHLAPKNPSLWTLIFTKFMEVGNISEASTSLSRAISADPEAENVVALKLDRASLHVQLKDYEKAAALYEEIIQTCPGNVKALKTGAEMYEKCGQRERSIHVLEEYLRAHPTEADLSVIDLLVSLLMENNLHNEALQHIEHAQLTLHSGKELPLDMKVKAGICQANLGNMRKAASLFTEFAESNTEFNKGFLHLKIARCYLSLKYRVQAIFYFYQALKTLEEHIEARLTLASVLLEESRDDEAISLLSPPRNRDCVHLPTDKATPWWCDGKVKLKLCNIFRAKGMHKELVDAIYDLVHESLQIISLGRTVKRKLLKKELLERVKALDDQQTCNVFSGNRSRALPLPDHRKVNREKKRLEEKAKLKEEKRTEAMAAGHDGQSDDYSDSDDDPEIDPQEIQKEPPLPDLVKEKENHDLILDLCKSLASLNRHSEALKILKLALKSSKGMAAFRGKLRTLGAQIAYTDPDPEQGLNYVKYIADQHPYSNAVWNCYYKVISRFKEDWYRDKHYKFVRHRRHRRNKLKDCAPPSIISGHHYTRKSRHQDAAREYLEAYKLLPENPLVNLCAGTALINLAHGHRLQNKHHCIAQGFAFLYNNLRVCKSSQEALYNIARAFHQVGLVTLAASYYEKVLDIHVKDYPIPKLPHENPDYNQNRLPGYCDLRREAAFNLHLIYKQCGSFDLARQVLRDHCTF